MTFRLVGGGEQGSDHEVEGDIDPDLRSCLEGGESEREGDYDGHEAGDRDMKPPHRTLRLGFTAGPRPGWKVSSIIHRFHPSRQAGAAAEPGWNQVTLWWPAVALLFTLKLCSDLSHPVEDSRPLLRRRGFRFPPLIELQGPLQQLSA